MSSKTNILIPTAAGLLVYNAYKSGTFSSLKEKLFCADKDDSRSDVIENHDSLSQGIGVAVPNGSRIDVEVADTNYGLPAQNIDFDPSVYQFSEDTCAIQSQHLILEQYGINVTQDELIQIAKENGWYAEQYGTPLDMVGKLLEYYGIDIQGSVGNNIFNLANEIAQGHQVIVGVDASELKDPDQAQEVDAIYGELANHALVVVGIDTSDPDNVQVIVTDPGNGNRQMAYPADQFIDAWKDSDCFMVSTNSVPNAPMWEYNPIDNFAGIPMDSLERLSNMEIDTTSIDNYNHFVDDLLENPDTFDDLLIQYSDLFNFNIDEDC